MKIMLDHPLTVFAFSLVALWVSIQIGTLVGQKLRPLPDDEREDFGIVINATLTLLALIIGFSFSMAVTRYDQRKNYEEAEANAIGTEYVRAGLLPSADVVKIRELLTQYLDQRLLFYTIRDPQQVEWIAKATAALQNKLWDIVQDAALARPTPPITLTVSGMNDVLNSEGYTQAAWWNRIPVGAWSLMVALAIFCSLLIGYDIRHRGFRLLTVFPLIVSVAFFLIGDIDSPRNGVIRVIPQNLISLSQSLHKSSDGNEKDSR